MTRSTCSHLIALSGNNGQTPPGVPRQSVFDADFNQAKIDMMMADELTFAIAQAERQAWVAAQLPANRTVADNVTKLFLFQPPW
jgi:hypothetical protein